MNVLMDATRKSHSVSSTHQFNLPAPLSTKPGRRIGKLLLVVTVVITMSLLHMVKFSDRTTDSAATTSNVDCGKICSYFWDTKVDAKFYPLLRKRVNCKAIFSRMQNPPYKIVKPPPQHPPAELIENYTQNGACPMKYYHRYFDESGSTKSQWQYSTDQFNQILAMERVRVINTYGGSTALNFTLWKYIDYIRAKHVAVVGTQIPWAEAMLINRGAKQVTVCEYNTLVVGHPRINIITPYKLAEQMRSDNPPQLLDAAFTFSSLEHTGLGRYGDPLMPFGDMEAVAQIWCLLKPGGLLFMGLPVSTDRKGCWYEWNAHRIYGYERLQHVTANWEVLDDVDTHTTNPNHAVFVLKKISDS